MTQNYAQSSGRPPVIGISGGSTDSKSVATMVAQVTQAGGIPMVFANHANRDPATDIAKIDALFVMGSDEDVDPSLYVDGYAANDPRHKVHEKTVSAANTPEGRARAAYEFKLMQLAEQRKMPTLMVCAAAQEYNVLRGGGLLQHLPDLVGDDHHEQNKQGMPPFCPVVPVDIDSNSTLGAIAGSTPTIYTPSARPLPGTVGVNENSFHHQAIDADRIGYGLRATAFSDMYVNPQGQMRRLVEAIEPDPQGPLAGWPMIGVQWHPEFAASRVSANLIAAMVDHGAWYAQSNPRDRSHDMVAAMATNIVSAGKNNRLPAAKSESYVQDLLTARSLAPTQAQLN